MHARRTHTYAPSAIAPRIKKGRERGTWDEGEYISALWARENLCITLVSRPRPSSLPYSSVTSN